MSERKRYAFAWLDLLWLVFLAALAILPPRLEIHKHLILIAIGLFQIVERRFIVRAGQRGEAYSVIFKILLASLLLQHTGGINSSYYLIYYLPVVTAAMYFEAWGTLAWTALASLAYLSFLIPALDFYEMTSDAATELAIRNLFFFLAAMVVNRFVTDNRRQIRRAERLAETLAETNRRLEQAQAEARRSERLAALGQLSAGLAHEIRNPLGIIKGSAEMLNKKLLSSDALSSELATNISGEVNRLNTIIGRFLDFARPSKLETRPEAVPPLVDSALKSARARWPNAPVAVVRDYAPNLPLVPLDAALCEQVFLNLVLNAYEAMGEGGGKLNVAIAMAESNGRRGLQVDIEDNGPGIPPPLRDQIFNPFFTTKKTGVGLGLSIVSKIVDDHRGMIRVTDSRDGPGKGTRFTVFLPVE